MQIGIPRESIAGETRAAATPATVVQLKKLGFSVAIEADVGKLSSFDNAAFEHAGAEIVEDAFQADFIFKVNAPTNDEIEKMKPGTTIVSFIWPAQNPELVEKFVVPRIGLFAVISAKDA